MRSDLQTIVAATTELAPLPDSVVRLLAMLDDLTVSADRVLAVIEKDPALTSNLLKLSNSAYYGMPRRIGSAREALILLGNKTVVTLAFASGMGEVMRRELTGYGMPRDRMWRHALGTAIAAAFLARRSGLPQLQDRAFTAGLVHDIGKLVLDRHLAAADLSPPDPREPLLEREQRLLGTDHCRAGAAIAESWKFPGMLVTAIRHHHEPRQATSDRELLRSVAAANLIVHGLELGGEGSAHREGLLGLTDQGVPEEAIRHLCANLPADLEQLLADGDRPALTCPAAPVLGSP